MTLIEKINKEFGTSDAIPGFKVMEWLRGVRDEHYRLSIEDPEAYKKMKEEARRRIDIKIKEQKKRARKLQPA